MVTLLVLGLVMMVGSASCAHEAHASRSGEAAVLHLRPDQASAVGHALELNPSLTARLTLSYRRAVSGQHAAAAEWEKLPDIIAPIGQFIAALQAQRHFVDQLLGQIFSVTSKKEETRGSAVEAIEVAARQIITGYLMNGSPDAWLALRGAQERPELYRAICQDIALLCSALLKTLSRQGVERFEQFKDKLRVVGRTADKEGSPPQESIQEKIVPDPEALCEPADRG